MPTQLALSFDVVPVTCEVQQRYHSIAPCLAGISTPVEQAQALRMAQSSESAPTSINLRSVVPESSLACLLI
jgi:hypothetical protein